MIVLFFLFISFLGINRNRSRVCWHERYTILGTHDETIQITNFQKVARISKSLFGEEPTYQEFLFWTLCSTQPLFYMGSIVLAASVTISSAKFL